MTESEFCRSVASERPERRSCYRIIYFQRLSLAQWKEVTWLPCPASLNQIM